MVADAHATLSLALLIAILYVGHSSSPLSALDDIQHPNTHNA